MDPHDPSSWRRLPGQGEPPPEEQPGGAAPRARDRGLRHVRRWSNWTAVALVGATAVTAGYFARAQAGAPPAPAAAGTQSQSPAAGPGQPCVTTPVAVSGGSGVTATVPAPAQACAPGTGSVTPPAVTQAKPHDSQED